jgi:ribosomal protein S18 acetylase RimI-like enzyme
MAAGDERLAQGTGQQHGLDSWAQGTMGGYISAATGIGGLFVEMAGRRLPELLPPLLRVCRRQPRLAVRSLQTAIYPLLVHEDAEGQSAELLSIMVQHHLRSHGIGALLLAAFLAECRRRSLAAVTVTVDAANTGAQRFYARHGFGLLRSITLYGRPMQVLRREIGQG